MSEKKVEKNRSAKIEKTVKCDVLECKNTFVQKTRRNIYCSPKCRELARKRRVEQGEQRGYGVL